MIRNLLAIGLCTATLALGVATSSISAKNRSRESQLDQLQRRCEQELRVNERMRAANASAEWDLFAEEGVAERERAALVRGPVVQLDI